MLLPMDLARRGQIRNRFDLCVRPNHFGQLEHYLLPNFFFAAASSLSFPSSTFG
jgi:hypothetical protein